MEKYRPYFGRTIEQIDALYAAAVEPEKDRVRYFRNVLFAPANVYAGLSAESRQALLDGAELRYTSQGNGLWSLPAPVLQEMKEQYNRHRAVTGRMFANGVDVTDAQPNAIRDSPDTFWMLTLQLPHDRTGRCTFKFACSVRVPSHTIDIPFETNGFELRPPAEAELNNAALNAALGSSPVSREDDAGCQTHRDAWGGERPPVPGPCQRSAGEPGRLCRGGPPGRPEWTSLPTALRKRTSRNG